MKAAFCGRNLGGKNFRSKRVAHAGFSLVEAIVALALVIFFIVQVFDLVAVIRRSALDASLLGEAIALAKNNLNNASYELRGNFNALVATSSAPGEFSQPFYMSLKILDITPCRREIKSKISWTTDMRAGAPRDVTFSRLIGNLTTLQTLGSDCGGNDFINQIATSSPIFAISVATGGDIKPTGIDIFRHNAFVSAISSESPAEPTTPDLLVTSIGENPQIVAALDFGPAGANALDAARDFLFIAQNSTGSQLAIVDINNPEQPFLAASSTLPGVAGSKPAGWSIFYYDSKIYIGTKRTAGHEFHIFDVSNPPSPLWLGSREVNHNINAIAVRAGLAYLATSGNIKDLIVLDVKNPAAITQKMTLDLPGSEDGKSLYLIGNTLYLGRFKSLNNSGHHDFYALDIREADSGGEISILGFYDVHADVSSVRVVGPYAFLATSASGGEFLALNVSSSTSITKVNSADFSAKATGIDYENGTLMFSSFGSPGIYRLRVGE